MARVVASLPSTPVAETVHDIQKIDCEQIASRAYEIYQGRGGTDGADLDDWLQAERELQSQSR